VRRVRPAASSLIAFPQTILEDFGRFPERTDGLIPYLFKYPRVGCFDSAIAPRPEVIPLSAMLHRTRMLDPMKSLRSSLILICLSVTQLMGDLSNWRALTPSPIDKNLESKLLVNGGRLWASGAAGLLFHTVDARHWESYAAPTNRSMSDLDFIEGRYWAPLNGTVYSSEDGIAWKNESSRFPIDVLQIEQGGDRWVATTFGRKIWSSADGRNWTLFEATGLPSPRFMTCAYGNGTFVAGGQGAFGFWKSQDGKVWTQHGPPQASDINRIKFLNGMFVAVGPEGRIYTSADGTDWSRKVSSTQQNLYSVTYAAGKYLAVGGQGVVLESEDGTVWNRQSTVLQDQFNDVEYFNGQFVLLGSTGAVLTSTDGRNWTSPNPASFNVLEAITGGRKGWVAVGALGVILTSPDGRNWERRAVPTKLGLQGVAMSDDLIVVVGAQGTVFTSTDGVEWTRRVSGTTRDLNSVIYANGQFMTGGPRATSTNGIQWTITNNNWPQAPEVAFKDGVWVSLSHGSIVLSSLDGIAWTERDGKGGNSSITASTNLFLSGGDSSLAISTNGQAWYPQKLPKPLGIRGVTYGSGAYVAVSAEGEILTSQDAKTWSLANRPTKRLLLAVAHRAGQFIAVGSDGVMLQSDVTDQPILTRQRFASHDVFQFQFTSIPGRTYLLQTSTDLNLWIPWQETTATGTFTAVTDSAPADANRHYRVLLK